MRAPLTRWPLHKIWGRRLRGGTGNVANNCGGPTHTSKDGVGSGAISPSAVAAG